MSVLEAIIKDEITAKGSMSVARFMALALGHPEHGYYMTRDPFGQDGDFTTTPEISQMFGEVIGAWAADQWMKMGQPEAFTLLECGPGRGSLMSDILRVTARVLGFHDAAQVILLENSALLKEQQEQALTEYDVTWITDINDLADYQPVIVIANEFLDALPIIQLEKTLEGWRERLVDFCPLPNPPPFMGEEKSDSGALGGGFVWAQSLQNQNDRIPFHLKDAAPGSIFETAPERIEFMKTLLARVKGSGLIIDYGHTQSACGDTLQAVKDHAYCDVFSAIGDADITAHVDFEAIKNVIEEQGGAVERLEEQGAFLKSLGVEMRAQMLADQNPDHAAAIAGQLARLIGGNEMGRLFKVLEFKI